MDRGRSERDEESEVEADRHGTKPHNSTRRERTRAASPIHLQPHPLHKSCQIINAFSINKKGAAKNSLTPTKREAKSIAPARAIC